MDNQENPPIVFEYTNWKNETTIRKVRPIRLWYGHTDWHKKDQWLLKAHDLDKDAERDFAVKDILRFI